MCGLIIDKPFCKDVVTKHCGLLGVFVEIKGEVVSVV